MSLPATIAGADWLAEPGLQKLLAVLSQNGEQARVAGGAVRNTLLGEPVTDIDIATTCLPDETSARATAAGFHAIPTGAEHGTITVVARGRPHEVTTLGPMSRLSAATRASSSAATGSATPNAATSPSTHSMPRPMARSSISSAGSRISKHARCVSSAMPKNASARTTCASCVSSASSPGTATAGPTPRG